MARIPARNPSEIIRIGEEVEAFRQTSKAMGTANTRNINPRIWCHRLCNGFTAAGTTCLTSFCELRTVGAQRRLAFRASLPATRPAARRLLLSTNSSYQGTRKRGVQRKVANFGAEQVVLAQLRLYNHENDTKFRGTFGPEVAS